jgi:signal transduction histidine kinase
VLALLLFVYAMLVFAFQYAVLTRQMLHDEVQDVVTVEGLLYFDSNGKLQLKQDYYSRPQSHLLVDRYMEVRDPADNVLYSSPTLHGMRLDGPIRKGEGDRANDERIIRLEDGSHVFLISHIHGMDGRTLLIRLGYSLAPLRTSMVRFLLLLMVAIPVALAFAAIAGQAIARRALRPIDQMTQRATKITANNLHDRLEIDNPNDELGRMAEAFNHLLGRLDDAFQQLRRFTADAAHELRTPLASIRTVGEVALGQGSDSDPRRAVENMLEASARLNETIDSLLLLSRVEVINAPGQMEGVQLKELVDEVSNLLSVMMEDSRVKVIPSFTSDPEVQADRSLLRIALVNILHNAWKFAPSDSTIHIQCGPGASPDVIQISVQDEGPGIAPNELQRVFDRFYTGSDQSTPKTTGAGLGLSITKLVIERFGGTIGFEEAPMGGARCVITLRRYTH